LNSPIVLVRVDHITGFIVNANHSRNLTPRERGRKKVICRRSARETGHPRQTPPNGQELHSAISVL
jgi:hypothetical protein